jgi:hypothetical protein
MNDKESINCSVTSDLMILYTKGRTSPETDERIRAHLGTCTACARAFGLEPGIRGKVHLALKPEAGPPRDDIFDRAREYGLRVWGFALFLVTRLLALLERLLGRFGLSTTTAKIRLYRARRRIAGHWINKPETRSGINAAG